MRLICPNCGAQYEVDDKVIPDDGRDVQCSNCGHTWFQHSADHAEAVVDEFDAPTEEPDAEAQAPQGAERERRGLDPEVAEVLREEAAREAAARRAESTGLETQPDLGLDESDDRAANRTAAARARMSRLRGGEEASPEDMAAALAAAGAPRRELLPDIEEINSSLVASQDREQEEPEQAEPTAEQSAGARPRRSFRGGFLLVLVLVAAGVGVYAFAPQIAKAVPQSEPYLRAYVETANTLRARADSGIDSIIARVQGLISG